MYSSTFSGGWRGILDAGQLWLRPCSRRGARNRLIRHFSRFFHFRRGDSIFFFMPQASAGPSPSARAPVVGLPQYCAFLLALFFFLRLLVDTQNSNLPSSNHNKPPFFVPFSSSFPDTTSQPQPWVSPISSPMLALPVSALEIANKPESG